MATLKNDWNGNIYLNGSKTNARGVAILISNSLEYKITHTEMDAVGNMLLLDITVCNIKIRLLNIYGPNTDDPNFFVEMEKYLSKHDQSYIIWCGDFNLTLNPKLDSYNYVPINNPRSRTILLDIINRLNLADAYRYFHPISKRFTWRRRNPLKQSRLDYFLISSPLTDLISNIEIRAGYKSDHSILYMSILINKFERGKGVWKFNTELLKDESYLKLVKECIMDEKRKYAVPVYNLHNLETIDDSEIHLTVDFDIFMEMLLLRIRGETIKYASYIKKKMSENEKILISKIQTLEQANPPNMELLTITKSELEKLREKSMKGHLIRSRTQWLSQGEKPTKYFCSLEHHNYTEKTVKKVIKKDRTEVSDQKHILNELKSYYSNLFKSQDLQLENFDLNELLYAYHVNKLDNLQSESIDGPLTYTEIHMALKQMKNNKTPGIDGFPAEFFKVFWKQLGMLILKALNNSFEKGTLSTSLRQCLIVCLPKKGKQRQFIKNWHPLSMLSVLYKIAAAAIANRIKPYLTKLISETQTGFVSGRYIGESTRLVYDIMDFTERHDISGQLMLIDFEKAFDSISWNFIYKTLKFFGFGNNLVRWVQLFNQNITARVLQCGFMSDAINIERGCRQGDPISPYLYILAGQVQSILISQCDEIKGINIKGQEFKIIQYVDDTTLFLDGSCSSFDAALNILEIFGSISGLNVNKDKTKLVWIGKKKHCKDKLKKSGFQWGCTQFDLLGLTFSVNLSEMIDLNFKAKILEIKELIKIWNKRYLTPLGKITVIKTFLLAKLNHLFLTLPNPGKAFIGELNDLFHKFIWSNKPDKINRKTITLKNRSGGLNMINLELFQRSLKTNWLRKIVQEENTPWRTLFQCTINFEIEKICSLGPEYILSLKRKTGNKFWLHTFDAWHHVLSVQKIVTSEHLHRTPLWYNSKISSEVLYLPSWYAKAITIISDLLDDTGSFMSREQLRIKYNFDNIDFLSYLRIKQSVQKFLKECKIDDTETLARPFIPHHINVIFKSKKGARDFYESLQADQKNNHIMKQSWNKDLNTFINEGQWNLIFRVCFKTLQNNSLIWFQLKILYRILGTNQYLHKIGLSDSPLCSRCNTTSESILHLLSQCNESRNFWISLENLIYKKIKFRIKFYDSNIIHGYLSIDQNNIPLNTLIITAKKYIFDSVTSKSRLHIMAFRHKFSDIYTEQSFVSKFSEQEAKFKKTWQKWLPLVET